MVVAPPPDFNLLLSTDKILELEPSLRNSKLFRALSIDTSKYSFDSSDGNNDDELKLDKTLVVPEDDHHVSLNDKVLMVTDGCQISNMDKENNYPISTSDDDNSRVKKRSLTTDTLSDDSKLNGSEHEKQLEPQSEINNKTSQMEDTSRFDDTTVLVNTQATSSIDSETIHKDQQMFEHNPSKPPTTKMSASKSHSSLLQCHQVSSSYDKTKTVSQHQHYNPIIPIIPVVPYDRDNGDSDFSSEESILSGLQHQQYKQPKAASSFDFELKRRSLCGESSISEFTMHSNHNTRESKFLSKSLTNLSFHQHVQHQLSTPLRTRKRISDLFSSSSSKSNISTRTSSIYGSASNLTNIMIDIDMNERQQGTKNNNNNSNNSKPRTPSVFRRFSLKKGGGDENIPPQRQTSLNVPQVKIQDENSITVAPQQQQTSNISPSPSLKNGGGIFRNLSFKSANNNNNNPQSPTEEISEVISALKTTSSQGGGRTFPVIRSPFSRAKFDKEISAEEQKRIYSEMLKSIRENDCRRLKLLLKRRRVAANSFEHDTSLIHESAFKGCEKCVKLLMKNGWCIDLQDDAGWRPLHAAVFGRSLDVVKCLLAKGADSNVLTKAGLSPLHLAVSNNDLYTTHELFQYGADPLIESRSAMVDEGTPFQLAINLKNTLVLDYFLLQSSFLV